jgi:hypothetical protein
MEETGMPHGKEHGNDLWHRDDNTRGAAITNSAKEISSTLGFFNNILSTSEFKMISANSMDVNEGSVV